MYLIALVWGLILVIFYIYVGITTTWKTHWLMKIIWKDKFKVITPLWKQILQWPSVEIITIKKEETKY